MIATLRPDAERQVAVAWLSMGSCATPARAMPARVMVLRPVNSNGIAHASALLRARNIVVAPAVESGPQR
jgi:hypothetical protein